MLRMTPDQHRPGTGKTPLTLQFVDTSCRCPTVCSHKLRQIRSHVAKTAHSRRRKRPAANKAPHKDRLLPNVTEHERSISTVDQCGRFKGLREIRPRLKGLQTPTRPSLTHTVPATPFAWKLSNDEQFLFNFYLEWVLQHGYNGCVPDEMETNHQQAMRSVYVPFAISQPALLAGILYVASRRYSVMASSTGRYREKTLWYKFMCLQNATRGVTLEHFGSNATVALTLVLASEAFWEGDLEAFRIHGNALLKMATTRANSCPGKVSELLLHLTNTSVYNPGFQLVQGPLLESPS